MLACQETPGNPAVREGPSGPLPRMAPLHLVRPADLPGPADLARRWHQEDLVHRPYQAALALHPTHSVPERRAAPVFPVFHRVAGGEAVEEVAVALEAPSC